MALAAFAGSQAEASSLIEGTLTEVADRGEGIGVAVAHGTNALLRNGLGDYPEAMAAVQQALTQQDCPDAHYRVW